MMKTLGQFTATVSLVNSACYVDAAGLPASHPAAAVDIEVQGNPKVTETLLPDDFTLVIRAMSGDEKCRLETPPGVSHEKFLTREYIWANCDLDPQKDEAEEFVTGIPNKFILRSGRHLEVADVLTSVKDTSRDLFHEYTCRARTLARAVPSKKTRTSTKTTNSH